VIKSSLPYIATSSKANTSLLELLSSFLLSPMHLLTWLFLLWPLATIYSYLGLSKASYTSVFCAKNLVVVDSIAQSSSSGLMTQQLPAISLMTQSSVIGLMAQPLVICSMAQSPAIGLMA